MERARGVLILTASAVAAIGLMADRTAAAGTIQQDAGQPSTSLPWMNPNQPAQLRARELVAAMTVDEKVTELHGIQDSEHRRYVPGIQRLDIPPLVITSGPAGVGPGDDPQQQPATALPAPIGLAATFDTRLADQYGVITGAEARDLGNSLVEGPNVNIARVPENGRTFEGYGEDPYLAGQIGAADIEGIQSQGIIAEVKHYAANNQESNRFAVNEIIDNRTLHEIYLTQFESIIASAHPGAVMCAYPMVNGTYNCENDYLLRGVLRDQWGFNGFVQSDFGAAHSTAASAQAGMDLEMPTGVYYADAMNRAITDCQVCIATVNNLLVRRFTVMFRFGLFGRSLRASPIPAAADGTFARTAAEEATVLLQNRNAQLPLSAASLHSVAVIGPYAGAAKTGGGGSSLVNPLYTVSPVTGISDRVGPGVTVSYDNGSDPAAAAALAAKSDVAVVMVGDSETEGSDRTTLALSGNQDQLVEAVAAANPHTVVVVKSGGPVLMPWAGQVPAIVEAWYPGEEDGNAVAAVLFGDVNPSGKLPITFPVSDSQTPVSTPQQWPGVNGTAAYSEGLDVGYRWYQAKQQTPQFPFGYGLSYTTFAFSHLHACPVQCGGATVSLDVTNTGTRAGADVAQVYVGAPAAAGEPPEQLQGFARVTLNPGQTRRVVITLAPRAFDVWDAATQCWTTVPGRYTISAGDSSVNLPLQASIAR